MKLGLIFFFISSSFQLVHCDDFDSKPNFFIQHLINQKPSNQQRQQANNQSKMSLEKIKRIKNVIALLRDEERSKALLDVLDVKIEQRQRQQQLKKCMNQFGNISICTNTGGFYLWAKMAAAKNN